MAVGDITSMGNIEATQALPDLLHREWTFTSMRVNGNPVKLAIGLN
jgi:hypothetical protein